MSRVKFPTMALRASGTLGLVGVGDRLANADWAAVAAPRLDIRLLRALGGRAAQKGEKAEERELHFCSHFC
jgi:hypothetical protein